MDGFVGPQGWLLIAAGVIAFSQLAVLFRYWGEQADRKVVGRAPVMRRAEFPIHAPLLLVLAIGAAAISFTDAAGKIAAWSNWPIALIAGLSLGGLYYQLQGIRRGKLMPLIRGFNEPYERASQPVGYWLSVAWNSALVLTGLAISGVLIGDLAFPDQDRICFDPARPAPERIQACSAAIGESGADDSLRGALLIARGSVKETARENAAAKTDYRKGAAVLGEVIRTGKGEHADFYNQGLAYASLGEPEKALGPFSEAILRGSQDADAHLERGNMLLDLMRPNEAWKDYDRVLQIEPDHPWARANRGMASAWMGDEKGARKDFAGVASTDPAMTVVRRGEALLAYNVRDWDVALTHLDEALAADPDDRWSKGLRAEVLRRASSAAEQENSSKSQLR